MRCWSREVVADHYFQWFQDARFLDLCSWTNFIIIKTGLNLPHKTKLPFIIVCIIIVGCSCYIAAVVSRYKQYIWPKWPIRVDVAYSNQIQMHISSGFGVCCYLWITYIYRCCQCGGIVADVYHISQYDHGLSNIHHCSGYMAIYKKIRKTIQLYNKMYLQLIDRHALSCV